MSIDDLWYRNAIIYCLDVEKFQDSTGDGIGDSTEAFQCQRPIVDGAAIRGFVTKQLVPGAQRGFQALCSL